jgi:signal transduction histidine kinase/CheY-like chemotaxis protein
MPAPARRRPSLRSQLVRAFAMAALVPAAMALAAGAWWASTADRARAAEDVTRAATRLVQRADAHLEHQLGGVAALAEALGRSPASSAAAQPASEDLADWLTRQERHHPDLAGLLVADAGGRVVAMAAAPDTPQAAAIARDALAGRDWFREPMRTGTPFASRLVAAGGLDAPVLIVSAPIPDDGGQRRGIVAGIVRREAFDRMAGDAAGAGRALVLDPAGALLGASDRSLADAAAAAPFLAASDDAPFWHDTPTGARFGVTARSARGWRAAVDLPRDAAYPLTSRLVTLAALVALCGVVGGVAMWLLAARALRPLDALAAAVDRIGDGDASLPAFAALPAELARLGDGVSGVAARVQGMRAGFEQEVAARTAELSVARDRAEREARLKSGFLAAMSHEIRTPMNSIVGMAELLGETPLDGEQREYCDTIRTSTDALLGVINDILDFSKIESQGVTLEIVDFDLRVIVEDAVELLAVKAVTAGIDLAARIEPGFDGRFRGDPTRLRQVVVNLVGNAVKFTREGGVSVRVATIDRAAAATRVRLEIVDTGIGMTADGIARLFRPFSQAEDSTTRQYGGTGLGLTISKQIVERMGGSIGVTSEPGHGSTFWVDVPFERSAALPAPTVVAGVAGSRALVLESMPASADALVRLLTEQGVRAIKLAAAADVRVALAGPDRYAILCVGIDVPGLDLVAQALATEPQAADTAIVALVPSGRRAVAAEMVAGRTTHRLTRPVRRGRLVDVLDAIAAQRPPQPVDAVPPAPRPRPAGGAIRVLVADDYFANQRLVTRLLEKRGYTVEVVADGQAAVEATLDRHFDVVLMDCNMPILDGYGATTQIRALERGRRTPILAMTANDSPQDRDICLRAGMDDYLVKPIQAGVVVAAIERWAAEARAQLSAGSIAPGDAA